MPVPSVITDLSTTAASNSPGGSENVFPNLDDYIRALSAFIAQNYTLKATLASPTFTGTVTADVLTTTGNTTLGNASTDTLNVGNGDFVKDSGGRTLIGSTSPVTTVGVAPRLQVQGTGQATSSIAAYIFSGAAANGPVCYFNKSRGASLGSFALVSNNDTLGSLLFTGDDGAAFIRGASITASVDGTAASGDMPGRLDFGTTSAGASVPTTRLRIDAAGNILNISTGGLGYGTGSGGTVTQLTSKSTGVTLNTANGAITMNNAALAASTSVSFLLTNSAIAAPDLVIVNIKSGATSNSYVTAVEAVSAGSCRIQLRNVSGGSLSEAVVLSFAVIKGATA